ncbi:sulfite exporter TauE/SafE family protein [Phaeodactylibacter luteus]|uniref:Probable membrane transporter protein n=1 Tax=Phaeodactylibacter luteus TaxID=1564516 RepID=A0A5C6RGH9_9BACT|nr:sulfite exporter TauE/SafE family protein [Phaeodactylibacter luteus]TXB60607.1 sulfite exporter TauE/SafE family protein [Phaeodactylibacter luteus]
MELELYQLAIVLIGSTLAGSINTLAGNGSAITLTILTELIGLPGNLANGTNRVGIFTQSAAGSYAFYRNGKLDLQRSRWPILLTIAGAIAGVAVAVNVSNEAFRSVFRFLMVLMLLVILVKPKRWLRESDLERQPHPLVAIPLYLGLGFYGGFIQMGMGVFFLAVMVLYARYSLVEANAVKGFVVGAYTFLVIFVFQWQGLISWPVGLLMAVGQTTGGYFTAHYAARYPQANVWAHRLLVAVVLLAIARLFDLHLLLGG